MPAKSLTPVVIRAVYVVEADRFLDGVNVAVVPLYETVPLILPIPSLTVNVFVLMVRRLHRLAERGGDDTIDSRARTTIGRIRGTDRRRVSITRCRKAPGVGRGHCIAG